MHKLIELFQDKPVIREWDHDGRLKAAGFEWDEPVLCVLQIFGTAGFALALYGLGCLADTRTPPAFTTLVFVSLIACVLACVLMGHIRRGIAFERSGRVLIRGGWVNRLELFWSIKQHEHIASVEVTKTEHGAGVAIITRYGGTVILSQGLSEPAARLAAVQLTMALHEMREALTSIQNYQQPHHATPAASWID